MTYTIERLGVTYEVEPYEDDGDLFVIIHSASGLESFGSDDLASRFDEDAHHDLAKKLEHILIAENDEP